MAERDEREAVFPAEMPLLPPEAIRRGLVCREPFDDELMEEAEASEEEMFADVNFRDSQEVLRLAETHGPAWLVRLVSRSRDPENPGGFVSPSDIDETSAGVLLEMADNGQVEAVVRVYEAYSLGTRTWSDTLLHTPVLLALAACQRRAMSEGGGALTEKMATDVMIIVIRYAGEELAHHLFTAQRPNTPQDVPESILRTALQYRRKTMMIYVAQEIARLTPTREILSDPHTIFVCANHLIERDGIPFAKKLLGLFIAFDKGGPEAQYGRWLRRAERLTRSKRASKMWEGEAEEEANISSSDTRFNVVAEAIVTGLVPLLRFLKTSDITPVFSEYTPRGEFVAFDLAQADAAVAVELLPMFGPSYYWSKAGTDMIDDESKVNIGLLMVAGRNASREDFPAEFFAPENFNTQRPEDVAMLGYNSPQTHASVTLWQALLEGRGGDALTLNWDANQIRGAEDIDTTALNGTLWSVLCQSAAPFLLVEMAALASDDVFLTMDPDEHRDDQNFEPHSFVTALRTNRCLGAFAGELDGGGEYDLSRFNRAFLELFRTLVPAHVAHRPFYSGNGLTPWLQAERLVDDLALSGDFYPNAPVKGAY